MEVSRKTKTLERKTGTLKLIQNRRRAEAYNSSQCNAIANMQTQVKHIFYFERSTDLKNIGR
jgi:DNA polymerase/3'-5' exonuclease PolX